VEVPHADWYLSVNGAHQLGRHGRVHVDPFSRRDWLDKERAGVIA